MQSFRDFCQDQESDGTSTVLCFHEASIKFCRLPIEGEVLPIKSVYCGDSAQIQPSPQSAVIPDEGGISSQSTRGTYGRVSGILHSDNNQTQRRPGGNDKLVCVSFQAVALPGRFQNCGWTSCDGKATIRLGLGNRLALLFI